MRDILVRERKIGREKEHVWFVGLNNENRLLFVELIALGSINEAIVNPRETFRVAILKGATHAIMVHNHPTGNVKPSQEDEEITDRHIQIGKIIGIDLVDHLIVSENEYFSFANMGLMQKLRESKKYTVSEKDIQELKQELELAIWKKNNAANKRRLEEQREKIVSKLKAKGMTSQEIRDVTGLSIKRIEGI